MARKIKSSTYSEKHPYMQPHKWVKELAFWDNDGHNRAAYQDFHERMKAKAGKLMKLDQ